MSRKYKNNFYICVIFYILVYLITNIYIEMTLTEDIAFFTYGVVSSALFPFVVSWMEQACNKANELTYWNNGVFTLCLVLSVPLGFCLFLKKLTKR
jgi:hypothetical protein